MQITFAKDAHSLVIKSDNLRTIVHFLSLLAELDHLRELEHLQIALDDSSTTDTLHEVSGALERVVGKLSRLRSLAVDEGLLTEDTQYWLRERVEMLSFGDDGQF